MKVLRMPFCECMRLKASFGFRGLEGLKGFTV